MIPTQQAELWVIGYGSLIYRKVNWWTNFFVSRFLNHEKLRDGQFYLLGSSRYLPNKWTLLYAGLSKDQSRLQELVQAWRKLGQPTTCIWLDDEKLQSQIIEIFADDFSEEKIWFANGTR